MISGEQLREVRRSAGIGLGKLAERTVYSKSHLGNVEKGIRTVTPEVVAAYERALGVVRLPSYRGGRIVEGRPDGGEETQIRCGVP
ncbi:helix-turn-helix domain-containing protein [Nocardia seriolae]|uniref:helix-turn-helix domain-containing protein n=2 Tax=Nocardia seriolae TaxID=37332 RepID=UPI0008FF484D|nr:XRE family transcriptional regulator [Nocardia seriolae]QOW35276.1 helix-turn-helix transcriptional regulator [Nocardia seriolae]QUN17259.1 helix-turn-helix transcriptional regulator [Nocardia seriolae]